LRQYRNVVAAARDEQWFAAILARFELDARHTVRARRGAQSFGRDGQLNAREGIAVLQRVRPRDERVFVCEGIESESFESAPSS
jgi:hypothetical protein